MAKPTTLSIQSTGARTATWSTVDYTNEGPYQGLILTTDFTTVPGADTVTITIQGKDPVSAKYYTILASTAISTAVTSTLRVFPGAAASANLIANDYLPQVWRVTFTHSAATSFTYTAGASLLSQGV